MKVRILSSSYLDDIENLVESLGPHHSHHSRRQWMAVTWLWMAVDGSGWPRVAVGDIDHCYMAVEDGYGWL